MPIEAEEAVLAGQMIAALQRSGQTIGSLDPFIAATAVVNGLPLVTNNLGHYKRIIELGFPLELDNWRNPEG